MKVPICLSFNTEYRNVAYVQYRDVQVPSCPDTIHDMGKVQGYQVMEEQIIIVDLGDKGGFGNTSGRTKGFGNTSGTFKSGGYNNQSG